MASLSRNACALVLLVCMIAAAARQESEVSPVAKVLKLMNDLLTKSKKNLQGEVKTFAKFTKWCKDQSKAKTGEISVGETQISKLTAQIEKARVLIESSDERIKELEEDVGRWGTDQKAAADVRGNEKADFSATVKDYGESLEALGKAITALKKKAVDKDQAKLLQESLLQLQIRHRAAPEMPASLVDTLNDLASKSSALLSLSESDSVSDSTVDSSSVSQEVNSESEAKPKGYEFQSSGVIDMLTKLKDKFTGEKTALEKEELNAQSAYEKMMKQIADNIKGAKTEIAAKKTLLSKTQAGKAEKEGSLKGARNELNEDSEYLRDTQSMCQLKASDFDSRKKLREEEISTLSKAVEIIGSKTVKGASALVQIHTKRHQMTSLAFLKASHLSPAQGKVAVFLSEQGRSLGSALLLNVAQRMEVDPFTKVKKMIQGLIIKLVEEATSEVEKKGWCDTELTTNGQTRKKKSQDVEMLTGEIEGLVAAVGKLTQEKADLTKGITELDKAMMAATKERTASKATNQNTMKDAQAAITAVTSAIGLLRDFYARSSEATAFISAGIEAPKDDAPATFDDAFTGSQAEGGGVVGMLEVILGGFTRLDSETDASEAQEQDSYKTYMFESSKDRALKANDISLKEATQSDKESALQTAKSDLIGTQDSLDKAIKYYEKLKPDCVDTGISYSERVAMREAEIKSLQAAQKLLKQ